MEKSEIMEIVSSRRSVRKYSAKPVEKDKLLACLEAARLAPSACNSQPWKYIVVSEPQALSRLKEAAFSGIYSATSFAKQAPVIVAIVSDKQGFAARIGSMIRLLPFYMVDIGISAQNFVLEAQAQGLGTCYIGWFDDKKAGKVLGVPFGRKVELLISVGYPDEAPAGRPRKTLEQMSSWDGY